MPGILNRIALLVLSLTAVASQARAGDVSHDDWSLLLHAIRAESWKTAADLSLDIMRRLPETASDELARARYTYMFALGGEVVAGELSHGEYAERIAPMIGQRMLLPERAIADATLNGPMFNQIARTDDPQRVMMIAANGDANRVHCFEYARLASPIDLTAHANERAVIEGRLAAVDMNADGATAWAARVHFDDAIIHTVSNFSLPTIDA